MLSEVQRIDHPAQTDTNAILNPSMPDLASPLAADSIHFEHCENCWRLSNGIVDLVVPIDFGPRIMRFGFCDSENLFKIFDPVEKGARIRGGHRMWVAPEVPSFTWVNDS